MSIPRFNISTLKQAIERQQSEMKKDIFRTVAMDIWEKEKQNKKGESSDYRTIKFYLKVAISPEEPDTDSEYYISSDYSDWLPNGYTYMEMYHNFFKDDITWTLRVFPEEIIEKFINDNSTKEKIAIIDNFEISGSFEHKMSLSDLEDYYGVDPMTKKTLDYEINCYMNSILKYNICTHVELRILNIS
jgi:hypothetical protein